MGTAPAWIGEGTVVRASSVERDSVRSVMGDSGRACHSLPEAERGAAGAAGARLSPGRAQHAGGGQLPRGVSQHLQTLAELEESWLATAEPPCQPVMMQSKRTSNADRLFWSVARIRVLSLSRDWELNPYRLLTQPQFLSSPQSSIFLPMYGFLMLFSVWSQLALAIGQ